MRNSTFYIKKATLGLAPSEFYPGNRHLGRTFHKQKTKNSKQDTMAGSRVALFIAFSIQSIRHFLLFGPFPRFIPHNSPPSQHAKKVMSHSPGLMDFATGLVNSAVITLPNGQVIFFEEFKLQKNCEINLNIKTFFGLVETIFGLVNVSFSCKNDFLCTLHQVHWS